MLIGRYGKRVHNNVELQIRSIISLFHVWTEEGRKRRKEE